MEDPDRISGVGMRRRKVREDEPQEEQVITTQVKESDDILINEKNVSVVRQEPSLENAPRGSRYNPTGKTFNRNKDDNIDKQRKSRYNPSPLTEEEKYKLWIKQLSDLERKLKKYGWDHLSHKDQDELGLKRELIELYEQRKRDDVDGFKLGHVEINSDNKDNNSTREKQNKKNDDKRTRQQMWEEQQMGYAVTKANIDEIYLPESEKYDYVFDQEATIDFTNDSNDVLADSNEEEEESSEEEDEEKKMLLTQLESEATRIKNIGESRRLLPVYAYRSELMYAIKESQALIIVGETGSGKTTQLPQYLVEDGYTEGGKYQIAVTQPRRVAAMSVATRVSDEMNVVLGTEVGYSIRFDEKTTPGKTILKYMTDGMLLREVLTDPELSKYSCIMIDEAHERTLATDVLLGLLKNIMKQRKSLKLLISSATVNAKKFSVFFGDCPIFNVPGRRYPVDIHYTLQPEGNYINAAITTIFQIHTTQALKGDILLFLTGQEEIENTKEKIEEIASKLGSRIPQLLITPIFANLPQEQQANIFQKTPEKCRKVVLATNIAETSLTIDGIKYVIDPGFVKENSYIPSTGMTQLLTIPCSKASVDQRAGRAGRVGPGKCFRLFTKYSYENELEAMPRPEIVRTNLSNTVLLLLSLNVKDLLNFPFLDPPQISTLTKSLENLYILGALNSKGQITELGKMMCEFPCEPEFAKVLHSAATHPKAGGVLEQCLSIVSMFHETTSIFIGNKKEATSHIVSDISSDHLLYLKIYEDWVSSNYSRPWCQDHRIQYRTMLRVRNIRNQLNRCCVKLGLSTINASFNGDAQMGENVMIAKLTKSFISGFPLNIVKLTSGGYQTIGKSKGGLSVTIHPSSVIFQNQKEKGKKLEKFILYQQLMLTSKEFVRDCLPIPNNLWLTEMVPQVFDNVINDK
ncbi:similar to Saccharomyces cerevisiae YNR011C PRP2 RNA-dependent ATPase in the DEAH-box family, required for activation of the spliceosome before the first transesterification step in RNA splicing [Maudiozyma barnettii]|uniref:RNA helicase n=1 Tax=Maudiozyma barnettii TaxID=61262 RepID=A0A8H2VHB4_9SACH|nr:DEAH-box RNA-dependent ATPase PRP2 [Kazachstania barnettii]CAB4255400.1 similar to Saccharomyces cerevisiae YNR011C PRP2 RNA-dependent ATPase in the DEAH-box family, required for activation of the spliceosome before the first transesterification step in RNA splicing [Kazachstania barnettii]CAD1783806.1 similar to Saccharomyces cerevisiae YNR011C PRP2 RNA-dependent ATPase in the DEAH-box family, required for activation of the spliceosome before the first transesterification step in RNA splicing